MTSRTLVEGLLRRVRPPKPRLFAWKKFATRRAVMSRRRAFAAKLSVGLMRLAICLVIVLPRFR